MTGAPDDLLADPLLRDVPTIEGFKVLGGVALFARIGQGGMGVVYRGHHCRLESDRAVKCLKPALAAEDPMFVKRLLREARVAAKLDHPNIVRLYDAGFAHGLHHLVMEYVLGESVRARVERRGPQSEAEALAILFGAASGLAAAHQHGFVHRDVKPDNLLVARDGRVKVVDLGLVKNDAPGADSKSLVSAVMGTPHYMAPEQWESADVTAAADVWALGATFSFVLTGEHAIRETSIPAIARRVHEQELPSLRQRRPDLRPEVHELFERCVQRRVADRFAHARELVAALRPLVTGGDEVLADAAAGSATADSASAAHATPPPRATLDRIRTSIETPVGIDRSDVREQRTIVSRGQTVQMPGRRRRSLVGVLAVSALVVLLTWLGYEQWFADSSDWDEVERISEARQRFETASRLLPDPAQQPAVIENLRVVLDLVPDHTKAKAMLAQALDGQAAQLASRDLDAAFVFGNEAVQLDPANTIAAQRHQQLRGQLQQRLLAGLQLVEPMADAVLPAPKFVVKGSVPPGVAGVTVRVRRVRNPDVLEFAGRVVAGTFEVAVDAADAGEATIMIVATDRHGVEAMLSPATVAVAGVLGAPGTVPDPAAASPSRVMTSAGLLFVPIPVRTFVMGSAALSMLRDNDETAHEVRMTQPFWLAESEVTRGQWHRVMATLPWDRPDESAEVKVNTWPATQVSWPMADEFCAQLTRLERDAGRLPAGYVYCLPSEAQWELAASGGGAPIWPHGDDAEGLSENTVFLAAFLRPTPVRTKQPNAFGLFDLSGNVDEWCADAADGTAVIAPSPSYADGVEEPLGEGGANRVIRGGNYGSTARDCRCAARSALPPETARDSLGFRPALAKR
jgi:formylglycine-generating enzyme required for sulfatase activity